MPKLVKRLKRIKISDIAGPESATERLLISTGESLLAKRGINGVALHEIAYSAKQANKSAVQYYFKNLDGLIDAIFRIRLRSENEKRIQLLETAHDKGLLDDLSTIMEIFFLPLAEQVDSNGEHSYCRFLMAFSMYPSSDFTRHPSLDLVANEPLHHLIEIIANLTQMPIQQVIRRISMQSYTFIGYLLERDKAVANRRSTPSITRVIDEAILTITAAMMA